MLLGQKINHALPRCEPPASRSTPACRHPDLDRFRRPHIKIQQRELTDWETKSTGVRTFNDVKPPCWSRCDCCGRNARRNCRNSDCVYRACGHSDSAVRQAVDALEDLDMRGKSNHSVLAAQGQMLPKDRNGQMLYHWSGHPAPGATVRPISRTVPTIQLWRTTLHQHGTGHYHRHTGKCPVSYYAR